MLWDARGGHSRRTGADPTRGLMLATLSVATSVDALAVGVSMALMRVSIWMPSVVIGLVAAAATTLGIHFGGRLGLRWGRVAEMSGGVVLLLISLQPLILYLTSHPTASP